MEGEDIEEAGGVEVIMTAIVAISLITVAVGHVMAVGEEVDGTTPTQGIVSIIILQLKVLILKVLC